MLLTPKKALVKDLFKLTLPLFFNNLVNYLITLSDNLFTGRLGDADASAAFIGMQISTVFLMLTAGIDAGVMLGAVQNRGKGNDSEARGVALIGLIISLCLGGVLTALSLLCPEILVAPFLKGANAELSASYLKALSPSFIPSALSASLGAYLKAFERPSASLLGSLGALAANLFFCEGLIFGSFGFKKMGVVGSASAFAIAKSAEALILSAFTFMSLCKTNEKPIFCKLSFSLFDNFLTYTAPLVLAQAVWISNTLFSSFIIGSLSKGPELCAFSITNAIGAATYILPSSLSVSLGILISKTVGSGDIKSLKPYTYAAQIVFVSIGILSALILLLAAEPFVELYAVSPEAKQLAKSLIRVLAISVPATAYSSSLLSAIVKSGGDVGFILKIDAFAIFIILIPLSLILTRVGAPVPLIFLALKSDRIFNCIPSAIKINRFRWARRVTEGNDGKAR